MASSLTFDIFARDHASAVFGKVGNNSAKMGSTVGGVFSRLGNTIGGEFGAVLDRIGTGFDHVGEHGKNMGTKLTAAGGILTGVGVALQGIGSHEKQATDQLKAAISASGNSFSTFKDRIDKAVKSGENFGHGAADTSEALRKLTQATNDPNKALADMALVSNLAAAKHISLSEAAGMVAKAHAGAGRLLKEFGITMTKNADGTANSTLALAQLSAKLDGQATASVDNFSGKVGIVRTKLADWTAQMGQKLGPVLTALGPTLMVVGAAMEIVKARQVAAAAATNLETAATVRQTIAQRLAAVGAKLWAAAQWLLNAALSANPIGLVIAAIALLVVGIVLAYRHSATFRAIVQGAFQGVASAASAMWGVIRPVFKFIIDYWMMLVGAVIHGAAAAFGWVPGLGPKLKTAAKAFDTFRDGVNAALSGIHDKTVLVNIKAQGNTQLLTGQYAGKVIPLAEGGLVRAKPGGTLALLAEQGHDEMVVPMSGPNAPRGAKTAGVRGLGGGDTYVINVASLDPKESGRLVLQSLLAFQRQRGGSIPELVTG